VPKAVYHSGCHDNTAVIVGFNPGISHNADMRATYS